MPVIVSNFAMFYSHTQARAKLPKKRRRIMPVEHLPRSLAVRSNPNQLQHPGAAASAAAVAAAHAARTPATLAPGNLSSPMTAGSNFAYYAPGAPLPAPAPGYLYSVPLGGPAGAAGQTGATLVPRGATLDLQHTRARINLSNKDLLPGCAPSAAAEPPPRPNVERAQAVTGGTGSANPALPVASPPADTDDSPTGARSASANEARPAANGKEHTSVTLKPKEEAEPPDEEKQRTDGRCQDSAAVAPQPPLAQPQARAPSRAPALNQASRSVEQVASGESPATPTGAKRGQQQQRPARRHLCAGLTCARCPPQAGGCPECGPRCRSHRPACCVEVCSASAEQVALKRDPSLEEPRRTGAPDDEGTDGRRSRQESSASLTRQPSQPNRAGQPDGAGQMQSGAEASVERRARGANRTRRRHCSGSREPQLQSQDSSGCVLCESAAHQQAGQTNTSSPHLERRDSSDKSTVL